MEGNKYKDNDKCDGEPRCSWYYAEAITSARGRAYLCEVASKQHTQERIQKVLVGGCNFELG